MNKLILIALLLAVKVTFADFPRLKYGKISKEDMAMTIYPGQSRLKPYNDIFRLTLPDPSGFWQVSLH